MRHTISSGMTPKTPKDMSITRPPERDVADRAADQRERDDPGTGDHAELDDPDVADRVAVGPVEGDGDDQVGEGQPVGAVQHEGVSRRRCRALSRTRVDPLHQAREVLGDRRGGGVRRSSAQRSSVTSGKAVMPLSTRQTMKKTSHLRIRRVRACRSLISAAYARVYRPFTAPLSALSQSRRWSSTAWRTPSAPRR